ncbi:ribosome biogenesis protein TSR3 isoform X1 [Aphis craccivora]|uniref:Ribosome biogenesis protein TSR3 isoform X1 n=1 Tax=Aphis craccivora TaxID=307492 RepID=A0A6G0Z7M5_APHCR|nr:ribosome biogenesis protein TSR3 isoform X1 [Aphis craccivora]
MATKNLQYNLLKLQKWLKLWRIKISENKSTHIAFTLPYKDSIPVISNEIIIPKEDKRLIWATHNIQIKRKSLNLKLPKFKHLTRKQIIRSAMTSGAPLKYQI